MIGERGGGLRKLCVWEVCLHKLEMGGIEIDGQRGVGVRYGVVFH